MTTKTMHFLDPESLSTWLPIFEENTQDIPPGYGIEHSADGGFYPYEINNADVRLIAHLKGSQGLDIRCASRDEALVAIREVAE
jgi:hypothetical protein